MIHSTLTRRLARTTAALLTVAGLLTGIGMQRAAADSSLLVSTPPAILPLRPARLLSVEATSPTTIAVRWQDRSEGEFAYLVMFNLEGPGRWYQDQASALPGQGSIGTHTMRNLEPATRYCAQVFPFEAGPIPNPYRKYAYASNELCATTPTGPVLSVPAQPFIVPLGR